MREFCQAKTEFEIEKMKLMIEAYAKTLKPAKIENLEKILKIDKILPFFRPFLFVYRHFVYNKYFLFRHLYFVFVLRTNVISFCYSFSIAICVDILGLKYDKFFPHSAKKVFNFLLTL